MPDLRLPAVVFGFLCLLPPAAVLAADWPQYRGPDQTGATAEKVLLDWPAGGPKLLWKIPTPNGFSSFAVSGGKAYTQVNRDRDGAAAGDLPGAGRPTGKELWAADVGVGSTPAAAIPGPRATTAATARAPRPRCNDGLVYVATPEPGALLPGRVHRQADLDQGPDQGTCGPEHRLEERRLAGDRRRFGVRRRRRAAASRCWPWTRRPGRWSGRASTSILPTPRRW